MPKNKSSSVWYAINKKDFLGIHWLIQNGNAKKTYKITRADNLQTVILKVSKYYDKVLQLEISDSNLEYSEKIDL